MPRKPPLLNSVLRWVLFAVILANVASEMVYTLLPVYMARLGASLAQIGLIFSAGSLFLVVLQFVGGWISDRIGRLRAIAIGSIIATTGYLGFWLAPSWEWILPALCLELVSAALVGPSFSALVAEQSIPENRGRTFGLMRAAFLTVTIIGPLVGGLLTDQAGFKWMLGSALGLYALAAGIRIWISVRYAGHSIPSAAAAQPGSFLTNARLMLGLLAGGGILLWIFITDGARDISFNISAEYLPLFLSTVGGLTITQIGFFRSIPGGALVLTTLSSGWISDRLGEQKAILSGFLLEAIGLGLFLISNNLAVFMLAGIVFGAGIGMMFPAFDSLISKSVPERFRGMAYGMFDSSTSGLAMPAPWLGGLLWEKAGPRAPFAATALICLAALIPVWLKIRLPQSGPAATAVDAALSDQPSME
jgi:MFS family permease